MVLRQNLEDSGPDEGRAFEKWPANGTEGARSGVERPGNSPNFAEVCNNAIARLDTQLAAVTTGAADASAQSCAYSAAGDLLRTFQWDAHATALSQDVKSLARSVARWRQIRRLLERGGMAEWLWPGLKPPSGGL